MRAWLRPLRQMAWGLLPVLLLPAAITAQAPERAPLPFNAAADLPADVSPRLLTATAGGNETMNAYTGGIGRPLAGAALGLPAGILVGTGVGYLTGPRDDVADGCMFLCVPSGPLVGATIGALVGPGIGAHLANGLRGNPWATVAGSVLGTAGGVGLGFLVGSVTGSTEVGFAVAIPVAVGLPALVESVTSR
ncbi:hypothetical protein BH23GEM3_BH23GEM3_21090 [soil metagenome]